MIRSLGGWPLAGRTDRQQGDQGKAKRGMHDSHPRGFLLRGGIAEHEQVGLSYRTARDHGSVEAPLRSFGGVGCGVPPGPLAWWDHTVTFTSLIVSVRERLLWVLAPKTPAKRSRCWSRNDG